MSQTGISPEVTQETDSRQVCTRTNKKKKGFWEMICCLSGVKSNDDDDDGKERKDGDFHVVAGAALSSYSDCGTQVEGSSTYTQDNSTQVEGSSTYTQDNSSQVSMVAVDADTQVEETCCVSMSQIILRLKEKVEKLKQNEHQLQLKDTENNEKLEKLIKKLTQLDAVKLENKLLQMEKEQLKAEHQESVAKLMEKHCQDRQDLAESITNQKLMLVSEKQRELEQVEQRYEKELHCAEDSKRQELEELALQYESQLEESVLMLRQVGCLQEVIDLQITEMDKLKDKVEQLQSMIMSLEKSSAELKKDIIQSYEATEEKNQIIIKMKAEAEELRAQKEQLTAEHEESQKQELEKVTVYYESKLEESLAMLRQVVRVSRAPLPPCSLCQCVDRCQQQCHRQSQQKQQELEQMRMQLQEVDTENNHLRMHCDSLLREQTDTCVFLEDESALLRKEVRSLQERIACQTREMETLQEAVRQHWAELRCLERDNLRLRRRMRQKESGNKQKETKLRDKT